MAGALTISTLNDSSGVLATQNGMSGIAKAWVNFNGSTATIRGSFNVGSITKNGTGDYTVNFTTAMPNANYSYMGSCSKLAVNSGCPIVVLYDETVARTTAAFRFQTRNNGTLEDSSVINLSVFSA